jgi:hypothetical protein
MHSGMQNTLVMLPDLITELKHRGYEIVTMSKLLQRPAVKPVKPSASPVLHTASKKQY